MANGSFRTDLYGHANTAPLTKPAWPYENLSSRRDSAFTKELEFDAYRRRGDDAESDEPIDWFGTNG